MKRKMASGAAAALGAAGAMAAPVTVSQTFDLSQLLNGSSTSIQFDLSATLAGQGLAAASVLSGNLVLFGVSDASFVAGAAQAYGGYSIDSSNSYVAYYAYGGGGYFVCTSYSWWSGGCNGGYYVPAYYYPVYATDRTLVRQRDILHSDAVADRMDVTLGGSTGSDFADVYASSAGALGNYNFEGSSYNGSGTDYYYNRERNVYESLSGALFVDLAMDAVAMQDFASDALIAAGVSAGAGQFRLTQATLTVQVDDSPASGVPEPATLALVGSAAALGIAATRRRRRAKP